MSRRTEVSIGKRFGRLVVLSCVGKRDSHRIFECKCDCGIITQAKTCTLASGHKVSCGCLRKTKFNQSKQLHRIKHQSLQSNWKGCGEVGLTYFNAIKDHAKIRGREFSISICFLSELFLKQQKRCALSGIPITIPRSIRGQHETASLDRVDSSKGYTPSNVQWIHKTINKMKSNLNQSEFVKFCQLISQNA